jgi:hypothetical protein
VRNDDELSLAKMHFFLPVDILDIEYTKISMRRDFPLSRPPFANCSRPLDMLDRSRTKDLRETLHSLITSYASTRSVIYLALANFALDHYATNLLRICCDADIVSIVDGHALEIKPHTTSNIQECLDVIHDLFARFDKECPGCKTATEIRNFVKTFCQYTQISYGLYRFVESRMRMNLRIRDTDTNWEFRGGCNCLVNTLLAAIIAEHAGVKVDVCRIGNLGGKKESDKRFMKMKQDRVREIAPNVPFHFSCNHLEIQKPGARLSPQMRKEERVIRSQSNFRCESIYNFLILPLEWMIADAIANKGIRKNCPNNQVRAQQYLQMLLYLKPIVDEIIQNAVAPYTDLASRLSTYYGKPQNIRRVRRENERIHTERFQRQAPDATDSDRSFDTSMSSDTESEFSV